MSKALNLHLSLIGQSLISLRSVSILSQVSLSYFIRQTEPKILRLVIGKLLGSLGGPSLSEPPASDPLKQLLARSQVSTGLSLVNTLLYSPLIGQYTLNTCLSLVNTLGWTHDAWPGAAIW